MHQIRPEPELGFFHELAAEPELDASLKRYLLVINYSHLNNKFEKLISREKVAFKEKKH